MKNNQEYRLLSTSEIEILKQQGVSAADWGQILVSQEFKLKQNGENARHQAAKYFLNKNDSHTAWKILLSETI